MERLVEKLFTVVLVILSTASKQIFSQTYLFENPAASASRWPSLRGATVSACAGLTNQLPSCWVDPRIA